MTRENDFDLEGIDAGTDDWSDLGRKVNDRYGAWVIDRKGQWIEGRGYGWDLNRLDTSGEMLDFIMQVAGKTWCSHEDLGQLVRALNDVFNPQGTLCSGGGQKRIKDIKAFLNSVLAE